MYNKKQKCWISASYAESHLVWCREPFNQENPAAMFDLADSMLEQAERGKQNAEAVYLMEHAARLGYAQAALAMGQLLSTAGQSSATCARQSGGMRRPLLWAARRQAAC